MMSPRSTRLTNIELHCKDLIFKGIFVLYNVFSSIADTIDEVSNV